MQFSQFQILAGGSTDLNVTIRMRHCTVYSCELLGGTALESRTKIMVADRFSHV